MNSYQKIKAENRKLHNDIRILVMKPASFEAKLIIIRYKLDVEIENAMMKGDINSMFIYSSSSSLIERFNQETKALGK